MQTATNQVTPELPSLDPGLTELSYDDPGPLQSLVIDHLYRTDTTALWVDSHNNATTQYFTRIAPSRRVLSQISVARAFTPFQHYSLIDTLLDTVTQETGLVVVPEVDWLYTSNDLRAIDEREMVTAVLDRLTDIAEEHEIPVLLTTSCSSHRAQIESYLDFEIECQSTRFGPRFTSETYETLVYPGNGYIQTTLEFWRHVLRTRHSTQNATQATEVGVRGAN